MVALNVNGVRHEVQAPDDTPLLYVLRNDLGLIGPQFGCGLAQCGACAVLVDGKESRSCVTPVASVAGQEITTLEGLPERHDDQGYRNAGKQSQSDRGANKRCLHEFRAVTESVPLRNLPGDH